LVFKATLAFEERLGMDAKRLRDLGRTIRIVLPPAVIPIDQISQARRLEGDTLRPGSRFSQQFVRRGVAGP
jgi:hypothetical protein